jgi:glycosyltransferase involved in cell wall biosynthesis
MKVSVIIPVYNSADYVKKTVQSVLNQKHQNIELILVDDHSTDSSFELISALANQNPDQLFVYKNPKKGACAARNFGFEKSTGDYIQYLDADDILSQDKISTQLESIQKYGNSYVYSCRWGRFYQSIADVKWAIQPIDKDYEPAWQWLNDSWQDKGMGQTSIWLTHRELIVKAGTWDESLLLNQDGDFFCRVLLQSQGLKFISVNGVYYRSGNQTSISQSSRYNKEKAQSLLKSFESYVRNFKKFNLADDKKVGLGQNFLHFMYQYCNHFPDLVAQAERDFYALGHRKMWAVGGLKFKKIASIIGFKNALFLKKILPLS